MNIFKINRHNTHVTKINRYETRRYVTMANRNYSDMDNSSSRNSSQNNSQNNNQNNNQNNSQNSSQNGSQNNSQNSNKNNSQNSSRNKDVYKRQYLRSAPPAFYRIRAVLPAYLSPWWSIWKNLRDVYKRQPL